MKRLALLLLALALLFSACGKAPAEPEETTTAQTTTTTEQITKDITEEPTTEPQPKLWPPGSPEPLRLGEMVLTGEYSVNDLVKKYGKYEALENWSSYPEEGFIRIKFKQVWIVLTYDSGSELSFLNEETGPFGYSYIEGIYDPPPVPIAPTEKDKTLVGKISEAKWTDPKIVGPRGIKIGDGINDVRAKFLDLSSRYDENRTTLYEAFDVVDPDAYKNFEEGFNSSRNGDLAYYSGAGRTDMEGTEGPNSIIDWSPEYMQIYYNALDMEFNAYENTTFHFTNGILEEINQSRYYFR